MNKLSIFFTLFVILLHFSSSSQNLNWAKQYIELLSGNTSTQHKQYMNGFDYSSDGGMITYGYFEGQVDFDPDTESVVLNGTSFGSGYITKLNSSGEFEWSHTINGSMGTEILDIDIDEDGNIFVTGYCRGTTKFDNSSVYVLGTFSYNQMFVLKLNSFGNFVWAETYGGFLTDDFGYKISVFNGKIAVAGTFNGAVNLDPNYSNTQMNFSSENIFVMCMDTNSRYNWINHTFTNGLLYNAATNGYEGIVLSHNNTGELFYGYFSGGTHLIKFDASGNQLMNLNWGNNNDLCFEGIAFDQNGAIYLSGNGLSTSSFSPNDLDPGPNQKLFQGGIFYLKLDANGNYYNGNSFGGNTWNQYAISSANAIDVDFQKNVYISGSFIGSVDFDPSPIAVSNLSEGQYSSDVFVAKYDSLGNYIWAYQIGNNQLIDFSKFIFVDEELNVTNCGGFDCTTDFDPGPATFDLYNFGCGTSMQDSYIQQIKQDSCDVLGAVIDTIIGSTCSEVGQITCHGINSVSPYSYSWDGGTFSSDTLYYPMLSGAHQVIVRSANGCEVVRMFQIDGPVTADIDAQVNCIQGGFIPGYSGCLKIDASNEGCTLSSGEITFVIPPLMFFDSSYIAPDTIRGDTLVWYYSNYNYQSAHFFNSVYYHIDSTANPFDSICLLLSITPFSDFNPLNNQKYYCYSILDSYDPNNLSVYPQGVCVPNLIDTNDRLIYTINFQNTGISQAINVCLLDQIDTNLDITTLHVLGSSYPVQIEFLPNNMVKFRMNGIYLSDFYSDEAESHGYLIFEIDQKENIPENSVINNSVSIYFDFNAPVVTNSVHNTVVDVIYVNNYVTKQVSACDSFVVNSNVYYSSGNYFLSLVDQYGCDSLVNLNLSITNNTIDNMVNYVGDSLLIVNQTDAQYQWMGCNFQGDYSVISGQTNQSFAPFLNGEYAVIVNLGACIDTSECIQINLALIDEIEKNQMVDLVPNPNKGKFIIKSFIGLPQKIALYDISSRLIEVLIPQNDEIEIQNIVTGSYYLKLFFEDREIIKKVIVD